MTDPTEAVEPSVIVDEVLPVTATTDGDEPIEDLPVVPEDPPLDWRLECQLSALRGDDAVVALWVAVPEELAPKNRIYVPVSGLCAVAVMPRKLCGGCDGKVGYRNGGRVCRHAGCVQDRIDAAIAFPKMQRAMDAAEFAVTEAMKEAPEQLAKPNVVITLDPGAAVGSV